MRKPLTVNTFELAVHSAKMIVPGAACIRPKEILLLNYDLYLGNLSKST